ncbi:MAG: hypothetical protein FWD48_01365 [Oscillospiraceae bacterium]|nr:hypothetical protein [Oscillospiraceae bacterium]
MKKKFSIFLAIAIIFSLPVFASASDTFTTEDALIILRAVAGLTELNEAQMAKYDFNNDSNITTANALFVLQVVAGIKEAPEPEPELPPPLEPLSPQAEQTIRENYARGYNRPEIIASDVRIGGYFGTYNGYEVVTIGVKPREDGEPTPIVSYFWSREIKGIRIELPSGIQTHKNSSFIDLWSAHNQRLISDDDLLLVNYYYNLWVENL